MKGFNYFTTYREFMLALEPRRKLMMNLRAAEMKL
jgi:hypothetical protein